MKPENIFVGNIKKCNNNYMYSQYGDTRNVDDFQLGHIRIGHIENYTTIHKKNALLLKIKNGNYVDLECFESYLDIIKLNVMTNIKVEFKSVVLQDSPDKNNDLFVDEKSLTPYCNSNNNTTDISVFKVIKKNKVGINKKIVNLKRIK